MVIGRQLGLGRSPVGARMAMAHAPELFVQHRTRTMNRYIVAITRWGRPFEEELVPLASALGIVAYDLRLRIAGPLPVVFARIPGASDAQRLLALVRSRGHGAVACDADSVMDATSIITPRRFELDSEALVATDADGRQTTMPHQHVLALLPARVSSLARVSVTEKKRSFSLGRAAVSAAVLPVLNPMKTTTKQVTRHVGDVQQVLYVIRRTGREHVLLREHDLRYDALGDKVGRTAAESMAVLSSELRRLAPAAIFDERLLERKKGELDDLHLAAHLTAVGHLCGQW